MYKVVDLSYLSILSYNSGQLRTNIPKCSMSLQGSKKLIFKAVGLSFFS